MNFVDRELVDGLHLVYPADDAVRTSCGGSTIAYVWKTDRTGENSGPLCGSTQDPLKQPCGIDETGRYFVYLCKRWYNAIDENMQISTLVHEAVHHAGPRDVTYSRSAMQDL